MDGHVETPHAIARAFEHGEIEGVAELYHPDAVVRPPDDWPERGPYHGRREVVEQFERMTEKIEATERKALAAAELQEEFAGDRLVQQFEALEYHGSADQQLLELKRKMGLLGAGSGGEARQIGPGGDVHEAEIEEEGPAK